MKITRAKSLPTIILMAILPCIALIFVPSVMSANIVGTDPENDVHSLHLYSGTVIVGDFADEIDIISFNVSGSNVELKVAGSTSTWVANNQSIGILWSNVFDTNAFIISDGISGTDDICYHLEAYYSGVSDALELVLTKADRVGMTYQEWWNGADWDVWDNRDPSLGTIGPNGFNATIPAALLSTLQPLSTRAFGAIWDSSDDHLYYDIASVAGSSGLISGFDLFVSLGAIGIASIVVLLLKRRNK